MRPNKDINDFVIAARNQGATDELIARLLQGRGWPEPDIFKALAEQFETRSGLSIPRYKRSASAKDAFLYLLSFSTLATWSIGLGSVTFDLIDRGIRDPSIQLNAFQSSDYQMADSLARILIAFPIYLLVMRYITQKLERYPEKLDSGVRKWLTYLALFIAAAICVGYLITLLTYFLRGELTDRFVAKVISVLFIAGGIFSYYVGSLGKQVSSEVMIDE